MTIRTAFEERFGAEQAEAIWEAACSHGNGINDTNKGDDPFKWALLLCIGYQCAEEPGYRAYHEITIPWPELKQWIKDHGQLAEHNGDMDYLALAARVYDEYMPQEGNA